MQFNLARNYNSKWDYCNSHYRIQKHSGDKWALIPHYYLPSMNITTQSFQKLWCSQTVWFQKMKVVDKIGAINII